MSARLTRDAARAFALTLPATHDGQHRGRADLRVDDRIFATLPPDGSLNVRTTPVDLELLVGTEPDTYRDVWGGKWVGVDLRRAAAADVRRLLVRAWGLAASPRRRREHPELTASDAGG